MFKRHFYLLDTLKTGDQWVDPIPVSSMDDAVEYGLRAWRKLSDFDQKRREEFAVGSRLFAYDPDEDGYPDMEEYIDIIKQVKIIDELKRPEEVLAEYDVDDEAWYD